MKSVVLGLELKANFSLAGEGRAQLVLAPLLEDQMRPQSSLSNQNIVVGLSEKYRARQIEETNRRWAIREMQRRRRRAQLTLAGEGS